MDELLNQLSEQFDPFQPLPPGDPRYVNCDVERGSDGLRRHLITTIKNSTLPRYQLLGGHRGGGKTTELYRVKQQLEKDSYFVVYCEADGYLNVMDIVESGEVMLAVAQQIWSQAKQLNISLETNRFVALAQELWKFLNSDVQITEIGLEQGFAKIKLAIKDNPDYRQTVRQHLRPQADTLPDVVNELVQKGRQALNGKGYRDIVVIVDNLDRLLRITRPGSDRTSHEILFLDSADVLRKLECHWIFTLPTAVRHSMAGARLDELYGVPPRLLPMIPVTTRAGTSFPAGIDRLIDIIALRIQHAGATLEQVFDTRETARRLAIASGGYVRELMTLMTEALNYSDQLPITSATADLAIKAKRNLLLNALKSPDLWVKLREIARTHEIDDSELSLQLLQNFTVLEYLDADGPWFDVSPIIKEMSKFQQGT